MLNNCKIIRLVGRPPALSPNNAEAKRAEAIIKNAANNALNKLKRDHQVLLSFHYLKAREYVEDVFDKSIINQCTKIIRASAVGPSVYRQMEQEKDRRMKARREMAGELKVARRKLHGLNWKIKHADKVAEKAVGEARRMLAGRLLSARRRLRLIKELTERTSLEFSFEYTPKYKDVNGWPIVPRPIIAPSATGEQLPYVSGIYFLWNNDCIEYVGQAKYLCNRLKLKSHHVLKESHMISFVVVNRKELTWAECYYIGICKPKLNFGRMASYYENPVAQLI